MNTLAVVKQFCEVSNESDLDKVSTLFHENATYYSAEGELFLGHEAIMAMQKQLHGQYKELEWTINDVKEVKPGVVHFSFDFKGINQKNQPVTYSGIEDIAVYEDKIQHLYAKVF